MVCGGLGAVVLAFACGGGAFNNGQSDDSGAGDGSVGSDSASGDAGDGGGLDSAADSADASDGYDGFTCMPNTAPGEGGCITSTSGVFVSMTGSDTNAGTMGSPFATISHAVANLGAQATVYVCGGTYTDQVTVMGAANLYGGLSCTGGMWVYSGATTKVLAQSPSFALEINAQSASVVVEDIEFDGAAAQTPGESSVAVLVNATPNAVLRRVTAVGGQGAVGATGPGGVSTPNYSTVAGPGTNASGTINGGGGTPSCTNNAFTQGGAGGTGGGLASGGNPGGPVSVPSIPSTSTGAGGTLGAVCGPGFPGSDGSGGAMGDGATTTGVFASAWQPTGGTQGSTGSPGQGGGGGSGFMASAAGGGGGGGSGGCGGSGGSGGGGGGASFGLLAIDSPITLVHCSLEGGVAGAGGQGGAGEAGQQGGGGGNGVAPGCPGGGGGYGGGGGGGGGGAGGISVALAYVGASLQYGSDTSLAAAPASAGGAGGMGGPSDPAGPTVVAAQGANGGTGLTGVSVMQMPLPQ